MNTYVPTTQFYQNLSSYFLHFFLFTYFLEKKKKRTHYTYNGSSPDTSPSLPVCECLSPEYNSMEYNVNYAPWRCAIAVLDPELDVCHSYACFSTFNT